MLLLGGEGWDLPFLFPGFSPNKRACFDREGDGEGDPHQVDPRSAPAGVGGTVIIPAPEHPNTPGGMTGMSWAVCWQF